MFCAAMIGAGLGFLWYNCHPARVFMGDTGSLPLGGALGIVAVLIHQPFVLAPGEKLHVHFSRKRLVTHGDSDIYYITFFVGTNGVFAASRCQPDVARGKTFGHLSRNRGVFHCIINTYHTRPHDTSDGPGTRFWRAPAEPEVGSGDGKNAVRRTRNWNSHTNQAILPEARQSKPSNTWREAARLVAWHR